MIELLYPRIEIRNNRLYAVGVESEHGTIISTDIIKSLECNKDGWVLNTDVCDYLIRDRIHIQYE